MSNATWLLLLISLHTLSYEYMFLSTAYLQIPPPQFKIFMDSVVWAFKHTMRNVAEIGLNILLTLLQKFAGSSVAGTGFFQTYFCDLVQHIFSVVTDTSHTSSELLALILWICVCIVWMWVFVYMRMGEWEREKESDRLAERERGWGKERGRWGRGKDRERGERDTPTCNILSLVQVWRCMPPFWPTCSR